MKDRGHVYFEPVPPTLVCTALNYLKLHMEFYEDISVRQGIATNDIIVILLEIRKLMKL